MIYNLWKKMSRIPGGHHVFSRWIGFQVPYTGTISALVLKLEPGKSRVQMKDRRKVRNHLGSIHAVALVNLAEFSSGVAFLAGLPSDWQAILCGLQIDYLKKARGTLVAEADFEFPQLQSETEYEVPVAILDASNQVVAKARAKWRVRNKAVRT